MLQVHSVMPRDKSCTFKQATSVCKISESSKNILLNFKIWEILLQKSLGKILYPRKSHLMVKNCHKADQKEPVSRQSKIHGIKSHSIFLRPELGPQ